MIIVVQVDGVLECGSPPGPVKLSSLVNICLGGGMVLLIEKHGEVWSRTDLGGHLIPAYTLGENVGEKLKLIRENFPGRSRYIFIGRPEFKETAEKYGFEYVSPDKAVEFFITLS